MASVAATDSNNSAVNIYAALNNAGNTSTASKSSTQEMEDRFLTLLTTQLKNQDPLNPLDNAEVTSQLAQINTVNGIEQLNTTLNKLLSSYDDSMSMQAASMIGKNVLVPGNALVATSSGGAAGGVLLGANADKVTVSILNSAGKVVQTEELGAKSAGSFGFVWDGKDADGNDVPAGSYTFKVEASKGGSKVDATAMQVGTVSALVRGTNGFNLDLGAVGIVSLDQVQQIF